MAGILLLLGVTYLKHIGIDIDNQAFAGMAIYAILTDLLR